MYLASGVFVSLGSKGNFKLNCTPKGIDASSSIPVNTNVENAWYANIKR